MVLCKGNKPFYTTTDCDTAGGKLRVMLKAFWYLPTALLKLLKNLVSQFLSKI